MLDKLTRGVSITKRAVVITGYSKDPSGIVSERIVKMLEQRGYRVLVVDPFKEERRKFVFRKTLLSWSASEKMISSVNDSLALADLFQETIDLLVGYSYGGLAAILQDVTYVRRYALLAPALGVGTVKFDRKQELLSCLLPGLREMKNEEFQAVIFARLAALERAGSEINFFLPRNEDSGLYEDEKVRYPASFLKEHPILDKVNFVPVKLHRDMIRDQAVLETILGKLGI